MTDDWGHYIRNDGSSTSLTWLEDGGIVFNKLRKALVKNEQKLLSSPNKIESIYPSHTFTVFLLRDPSDLVNKKSLKGRGRYKKMTIFSSLMEYTSKVTNSTIKPSLTDNPVVDSRNS